MDKPLLGSRVGSLNCSLAKSWLFFGIPQFEFLTGYFAVSVSVQLHLFLRF